MLMFPNTGTIACLICVILIFCIDLDLYFQVHRPIMEILVLLNCCISLVEFWFGPCLQSESLIITRTMLAVRYLVFGFSFIVYGLFLGNQYPALVNLKRILIGFLSVATAFMYGLMVNQPTPNSEAENHLEMEQLGQGHDPELGTPPPPYNEALARDKGEHSASFSDSTTVEIPPAANQESETAPESEMYNETIKDELEQYIGNCDDAQCGNLDYLMTQLEAGSGLSDFQNMLMSEKCDFNEE